MIGLYRKDKIVLLLVLLNFAVMGAYVVPAISVSNDNFSQSNLTTNLGDTSVKIVSPVSDNSTQVKNTKNDTTDTSKRTTSTVSNKRTSNTNTGTNNPTNEAPSNNEHSTSTPSQSSDNEQV